MKKFLFLIVVVSLIGSASSSHAMCVYNKSGQTMHVSFLDYSKTGSGFIDQWYIGKGEKKCKTGKAGEVRVMKNGVSKIWAIVEEHGWVDFWFEKHGIDNKKSIYIKSYRQDGSVHDASGCEW